MHRASPKSNGIIWGRGISASNSAGVGRVNRRILVSRSSRHSISEELIGADLEEGVERGSDEEIPELEGGLEASER